MKKVSWKEFANKIDEVCKMFENLDENESKLCAANYACEQIVIWAANNYYEQFGILEETKFHLREICKEEYEIKEEN